MSPPRSVPTLRPCGKCGVLLEKGTGRDDLAWHACPDALVAARSGLTATEMVAELASSPDLTLNQAATGFLRHILARAGDGEAINPRDVGEMLQGLAKLAQAGGGDDYSAALREFFADG